MDKEGEVIIYSKGFRLKGKGASDKGELINFSEIKEFYYRDQKIFFITFSKEKYVLRDAVTLFDQLLIDIYKARNEFLIDALFMKRGKLKAEYECDFDRVSKFGKPISKGEGTVKLFEKSMVVVPRTQDAFYVHYDFVNFHEFDEDYEYNLKIAMDDGQTIFLSRFGNDFEFFQEKVNELLGGMYETLVNGVLKESFPYFHAGTLLKMAYKMKGGKGVHKKDLMKIDPELAKLVDEFVFDNEDFKEKIQLLADEVDDYGIYYGIAKDPAVETSFIKWVMFTIPSKNIVSFTILPRWKKEGEGEIEEKFDHDTYFFRIIMEKGNPADKVEDKIREIDQSLVILDFAKDACYKDKRDLRHSPYQYAIRKLPFLRILRKSYVGKAASKDVKQWKDQVQTVFKNAALK
ncbi:hypothetical protein HN709_03310 [Candidatus Peregrinibacteria bacterium]|nr:hypothetical protein [Candidatus Peregrinibacteria bacterium]MBT7736693.1 hypothetical protein [Candidatus Peregrinibacteria bacterium]